MNLNRDEVLSDFEEARRWTYSFWNANDVCPQCLKMPRTVSISSTTNKRTNERKNNNSNLSERQTLMDFGRSNTIETYHSRYEFLQRVDVLQKNPRRENCLRFKTIVCGTRFIFRRRFDASIFALQ